MYIILTFSLVQVLFIWATQCLSDGGSTRPPGLRRFFFDPLKPQRFFSLSLSYLLYFILWWTFLFLFCPFSSSKEWNKIEGHILRKSRFCIVLHDVFCVRQPVRHKLSAIFYPFTFYFSTVSPSNVVAKGNVSHMHKKMKEKRVARTTDDRNSGTRLVLIYNAKRTGKRRITSLFSPICIRLLHGFE